MSYKDFSIFILKELWEAYSNRTVRPSMLLIWIWGPFKSSGDRQGAISTQGAMALCKLHKIIQGTSGEVIK